MAMQSESVSQAAAFLDNARARQIARAGSFIEWPHCEGDWRNMKITVRAIEFARA